MSIENGVMFLRAIEADEALSHRLFENPTLEGWLEIASEAGFEVTPAEFRSIAERLFERELDGDQCVTAFVEGELDDEALSKVAGGASGGSRLVMSSRLTSRLGAIRLGGGGDPFSTDTGPSWYDQGGSRPGSLQGQ